MGHQQWLPLFMLSFIILIGQVRWTRASCAHDDMKTHYTRGGGQCKEACHKANYDYFWCYTKDSWDYCSPTQNIDYQGFKCRKDHPCGKYGKNYYWCKRETGDWGYCAPVESRTVLHISSTYHSMCINDCSYDEYTEYFWCYTEKGWDYCSPMLDVTYKNEPCRWDHACDTHGETYTWCWTKSGYDYCGVINPCECTYYSTHRNKRDTNNMMLFCNQMDREKKFVTTFSAEPYIGPVVDDRSTRNEIINLIAQWNNEYLNKKDTSPQIHSSNCYVEQRKVLKKGKESHVRLKIKLQSSKQDGLSTTVSDILIPIKMSFPDRYIRMAFLESFRNRAKITLETNECKDGQKI